MRKLLFLLFVLSACSKPSKPTTPTSTTTTPGGGTTLTSAKYIPNWYNNDTTGIISIGLLNGAAPHKYKNQSGTTNHQQQSVMVNIRTGTPFIAYNGFYQSRRIY